MISGQWLPTGGPTRGGYVQDLCVSGPYIYVTNGGTGVFRSTDNGVSWKAVNAGLTNKYVYCLAAKDNNIYAGCYRRTDAEGYLFLSADSGTTWKCISSGIPEDLYSGFVSAIGVCGSNIFISTNNHVLRSADKGTSWNLADSGLFNSVPKDFIEIGNYIFAGTNKGIFQSFNEGISWVHRFGYEEIGAMVAIGNKIMAGSSGLYVSSDSGQIWNLLDLKINAIRSLAVSGDTIFARSDHGISVSYDSASSWTTINTKEIACSNFTSLALAGNNLFVSTHEGVYKSSNCGEDWSAGNFEVANLNVLGMVCKGDTIFATDEPGAGLGLPQLYRSVDNGINWTVLNKFNSWISNLFLKGNDVFVCCTDTIYHSSDNGITWSTIGAGMQVTSIAAIGNTILAGTENDGLYRTTDNGKTWWASDNTGLPDGKIVSLAEGSNCIFAGTTAGLFRSGDNGIHWTAVNSGNVEIFAKHLVVEENTIVAGETSYSVYISTDNGQNWTAVTDSTLTGILSLAIKDDVIFVGTYKDLVQITYNGSGWNVANTGLITSEKPSWVVSLTVNGTHVFAGTRTSSVWRRPLSDFPVSNKTLKRNILEQSNFKIVSSGNSRSNATIAFTLSHREHVVISVYNLSGVAIKTLTNNNFESGSHMISWAARALPAGFYLVKMKTPANSCTKMFTRF
jgi:hypothetical protein